MQRMLNAALNNLRQSQVDTKGEGHDRVLKGYAKIDFCSVCARQPNVGWGFAEDALQEPAALAWQVWFRKREASHSAEVSWVLLVCCGRPQSSLGGELGLPKICTSLIAYAVH